MAEQRPPLWPKPIPVIGVTGEYGSGKTLFGLTVSPGPGTLIYDNEKSSASYADIGQDRVDVPTEMMEKFGGRAYTPEDTFLWWRDHVRAVEPGKYRVIVLDPASEIEEGLADFVEGNPEAFGKTRAQYLRSSALKWADVKSYWKRLLTDLASRCETFVFAVHLRSVWADNKPTAKKEAKGKSTLMELASLFLWMERKADREGNRPAAPSAIVKKDRLVHTRVVGGKVLIQPAMPPRLPEATPDAIRKYLLNPPDYSKLDAAELAPEQELTEDERLELRIRMAEAEADVERLRMENETRRARSAANKPPSQFNYRILAVGPGFTGEHQGEVHQDAPAVADGGGRFPACPTGSVAVAGQTLHDAMAATGEGSVAPAEVPTPRADPDRPARPVDGHVTDEQLEVMADLRDRLFAGLGDDEVDAGWRGVMARRGVISARDLTRQQGDELIASLRLSLGDVEGEAEKGEVEAEAGFPKE